MDNAVGFSVSIQKPADNDWKSLITASKHITSTIHRAICNERPSLLRPAAADEPRTLDQLTRPVFLAFLIASLSRMSTELSVAFGLQDHDWNSSLYLEESGLLTNRFYNYLRESIK